MKKRVIRFFVLLLAGIAVLGMAHLAYFGGITSFAVFTSGPGAGQTTVTLQDPDTDNLADSYFREDDSNRNFGDANNIDIGQFWQNSAHRGILKFNVSFVPEGQVIDDAKVCLSMYNAQAGTDDYTVHRITRSWVEGTGGYDHAVDWDTYDGSNAWTNPGGDFDSTIEDSVSISNTDGWYCWNVTSLVESWYNGSHDNHGLLLKGTDETSDLQLRKRFRSSDYGTAEERPYMNITYSSANVAPTLTLVHPQDGATYGYNESLSLNYSANDADDNLDACWYNLDGGENTTLASCANTTFDIAEGDFTLNIYANDTEGEEVSDSATFTINVGAPSITLHSPVGVYLNYQNVTFSYTPTDIDLDSCELWGNFTGNFVLNQTDTSPTSGSENYFYLNLTDDSYLWNVACNDTQAHKAINGNQTFHIDTAAPSASVTEPSGTKTSLAVTATFSVSDSFGLSYCYYNVTDVNGASLVSDTEITSCASNTSLEFVLGSDQTNAQFSIWVNDSAGNSNTTSSTFSVDTSTSPPGNGDDNGNGGSPGGSLVPPRTGTRTIKIGFSDVGPVLIKRGSEGTVDLEVTSNEAIFLNKCKLQFPGTTGAWLSNSQQKGLSRGEKFVFNIALSVPEDVEPGSYAAGVVVKCDEGQVESSIDISVYRNAFEAVILDYERVGNELRVTYSLGEYVGEDHEIVIDYSLLDFDGVARYSGQEVVILGQQDSVENVIVFDLPKDSFGEFMFEMVLNDGLSEVSTVGEIFLPSQRGFTGLVISDENRKRLSLIGGIVILAVIIFAIVKLIFGIYRNGKKISFHSQKKKKMLIELDL